MRAVQVGGPLGAYVPADQLDLPMDYEAFAAAGAMVGHGGVVVFDDTVDMARQARFAMEFCAEESCGKCTPCRVGAVRGVEVIDRLVAAGDPVEKRTQLTLLTDLCDLMADGSLCAMGGLTPMPVRSVLEHFPEDLGTCRLGCGGEHAMTLLQEHDFGTPGTARARTRSRSRSTGARSTVPAGHVGHARRRHRRRSTSPSCAPPTASSAFGSCRLCLVEIDGRKGTPASCTTPVEPGMRVSTQTPRLDKLRRGVVELYLTDHPADCQDSPAGGDCELHADGRRRSGSTQVRYGTDGHEPPARREVDDSNPYFTFDASACIVCSRCVRACDEIQGTFALTISGRGFDSQVAASAGETFMGSECVSCGACVQACPTTALEEKTVVELGMPTRSVLTTCAYCGVGCSFKAEMRGDEVVRMVPYKDGGANEGHSCVKGRFAWGYASHADRVLTPMMRETITDPWREVSWDEAIAYTAATPAADPGRARRALDRRHHLVAVHERGGVRRPEDDPGGVRQQQRRHLRAGVPLPDRLRPQADVRHLGRHAGLPVGRRRRRHHGHRRQPDRRAPGVRLADEAAAARGRAADRRSTRAGSTWCAPRTSRPTTTCSCSRAPTSPSSTPSRTSSSPRGCVDRAYVEERCEPDDFAPLGGVHPPARRTAPRRPSR